MVAAPVVAVDSCTVVPMAYHAREYSTARAIRPRLLEALRLVPAAVAGHSYGELCALTVAGVLPADRLVELSRQRGDMILAATGADPVQGAA